MTAEIRPIDQSRACRIALGVLDGNDAEIVKAVHEAEEEGTLVAVLASATRSWVGISERLAGPTQTRDALQSAIFEADLSSDD